MVPQGTETTQEAGAVELSVAEVGKAFLPHTEPSQWLARRRFSVTGHCKRSSVLRV